MAEDRRDTWITGVGIVSCVGEGKDAHWLALNGAPAAPDLEGFAPYPVHRLAKLELDRQIPKKGDQRQMEPWQRIGTYSAGLALDSAGVKGNTDILSRMDMIVAAGGGERDEAVDGAILNGLSAATDPGAFLNEQLMTGLRPTLFLAQLSNLLAGNISIVHGVTGSSRSFMGEEAAGIDAVRIAHARIAAGQSDIALVGGAYNAERKDLLLLFASGGYLLKDGFAPLWERAPLGGGMAMGSMGAFLVLESADHALARGARPIAKLAGVRADRTMRGPGDLAASLKQMWSAFAPQLETGALGVLSGATGAEPATGEERQFLDDLASVPSRVPATHLGHGLEAQFPMNVALAALMLDKGQFIAPQSGDAAMPGALRQVMVTSVGHWRGEGLALLQSAR